MAKYDVVVIGGGPGGYPAAIRAAQLGASVALVERERLGGTCLNWGCIPTKAMIAATDLCARIRSAGEFGISVGKPSLDYGALVQRRDGIVERLRGGVSQLLKAHRVHVVEGTGSFLARHRVAVTAPGGTQTLEAGAVIVATGSASALPSFLPRHPRVVDSRGFLALNRLPDSLLVLGGGVIGCEFACAAAQWGAAVTVVELLEDIVLTVDPDLRGVLRRHMEQRLGIRVLTGKPLENIAASDGGVSGTWGGEALRADGLLAAVGRQPVTAELNLAQTGLSVGTTGHIEVDEFGQTAAPRVFAVGDVTGRSQLAHAATAQGLVAAGNACGKQRRAFETVVPQCIFTAPEIGSVGLTEPQAAAAGRAVVTGKYPFAHLGKALALGETAGFVKWVADARTGQLLGAHAVGPHATELIAEATVAIRAELTVEELGRTIHCHPTLAETWMEAAHAAQGACIHLPPPRR